MTTQQLIYLAGRWPWKWFKVFREAAHIAEHECAKFNLLQCEHNSLKLQLAEIQSYRLVDAEKAQSMRDEIQSLKTELATFQKRVLEHVEREKLLSMEVKSMLEERTKLVEQHDRMKGGVATLFEFIRRSKATADNGAPIPNMRLFPNAFRQ